MRKNPSSIRLVIDVSHGKVSSFAESDQSSRLRPLVLQPLCSKDSADLRPARGD